MGVDIHWPFQMPRKPSDSLQGWLNDAIDPLLWDSVSEEERRKRGWTHKKGTAEYAKMQAHKDAVDQKARMAEFQAAQQGARQSFVSHGKPFSMSRYKDTSMFPVKGTAKSDPARLQASPVGYDKEEWWRQSPYRSPVQENYSIFSMKPYSW